jgi:hypothetical protein
MWVQCHFSQCLERGKLVAEAHAQEKSEQQSLRVQVSANLTPEICINNASSNSRLTTAGRQAIVAETILRTVSRLFFLFFFVYLPLMREQLNYTCNLKNLLKLYCI